MAKFDVPEPEGVDFHSLVFYYKKMRFLISFYNSVLSLVSLLSCTRSSNFRLVTMRKSSAYGTLLTQAIRFHFNSLGARSRQ